MEDPQSRPICIAGLGNPGHLYSNTPHNIGFRVIDELAKRHHIAVAKQEGKALVGGGQIAARAVVLVKPITFMNLSGEGIGPVLKYRNLTHDDLIVVHDELDLKFGALRIKLDGSAAGHNGVKSIIAVLETEVFRRVRVGIHPDLKVPNAAKFVLAPFGMGTGLLAEVEEVVSYAADAVESMVAEGADKTMAKFNRRAPGSK